MERSGDLIPVPEAHVGAGVGDLVAGEVSGGVPGRELADGDLGLEGGGPLKWAPLNRPTRP